MMRQKAAEMELANATSAAHWLKQGGFSWWSHVVKISRTMNVRDETCVGVETPIGSRSNRKTLAAQKLSPEFSDISSDEEI
jgi:hypothetical protein